MRLLPFLDAGEFPQNLKIDDEGVRYDDALGRDIHCPIDGESGFRRASIWDLR